MRWVIYIGLIVVIIPAIVVAIGAALPKEHVASRKGVMKASPEAVFALIAGPSDWRGVKYERLSEAPLKWRETDSSGDAITYERVETVPAKRIVNRIADPKLPFFLWLRHMTGLKLTEIHRRHLGTQLRDADREVTLHRGGLPEADSMSLAAHLLGQLTTPSQAAVKAETRLIVQDALNNMDPTDREVLALKHFEQLSTSEIAEVLGMSKAGAGSRYLRAIKRLREILSKIPGFME